MFKKISILIVILLMIISTNSPITSAAKNTNIDKSEFTDRELAVLETLQGRTNSITVDDKEDVKILDNNFFTDTVDSFTLKNKKVKMRDIKQENAAPKNHLHVQVFENINNTEVLNTVVKKLKEINDFEIQAPPELVANNVGEAYYKIPYTIIISSPKYTGVFDFDRFYINDIDKMSEDEIKGIVEYNTINNLDKPMEFFFYEHEFKNNYLEMEPGEFSVACIACVGGWNFISSNKTTAWTNVGEVNAIKGVDTTFTLSSNKTAKTSVQVKLVTPNLTQEASGSSSVTLSGTTTFPLVTSTLLTSNGKIAQTQIEYSRSIYRTISGNEHTKVTAQNFVGGSRWSSSITCCNGASYNSVDGPEFTPGTGSSHEETQTSSYTFSHAVGVTVYGNTVNLNNTTTTSTGNKWKFLFKSGYGYQKYKLYNQGTRKNLTAR
ncbi:hypothetical protein FIU87_10705 [Bacillus sp. THAF10]|uniref:hypothetical protein n=1 Tax=Bacillus sp. THAF10 TaxID=2587848 RepID=UPI0012680549|nr:hypothetical protein [Bacillus sp. THAF10]QFT89117.1 hypothetical protein FIU87_10705 [Bacillus sp. THAF10]